MRRDGRCSAMVERETGIEPALVAWKATVLPLNYSRAGSPACVAPVAGKAAGYRRTMEHEAGGGRWIRTTEGVSQQIYSLPPLATWVSLRLSSMDNQGLPKSQQFWSARGRMSTVIDSKCRRSGQTLKRKCSTSPSCTRYSLPSRRSRPASRAPDSPLYLRKSS